MIDFEHDTTNHRLTCVFSGRLDSLRSAEAQRTLDQMLSELADPQLTVVINLSKVEYITSAFLRICILLLKKLPPGQFQIVECTPAIKNTFVTAGVDEMLKIS